MYLIGIVFIVTLFAGIILLTNITRRKVIDQPLAAARERQSPVAEFVDDLQRNRWAVIIVGALIVATDKVTGLSHGLLQSKWTLAGLLVLVFAGRLLLRRK